MNWLYFWTHVVFAAVGLLLLEPVLGEWPSYGVYLLIGAWTFMGVVYDADEIKTEDRS